MAQRIEDYAVIGDTLTCALVGRDGSIDWLCLPRIDSPACFAALLGTAENGRWLMAPQAPVKACRRRYRGDTLILETELETDEGVVALIDFMPVAHGSEIADIVRIVEGRQGSVDMGMELIMRMDYGATVPWVRRTPEGIRAVAGPEALELIAPVPLEGRNFRTEARFTVRKGDRLPFRLVACTSYRERPEKADAEAMLVTTERYWQDWSARCTVQGRWREPVLRSLLTLKALTYSPSGGIAAAATTSLPEQLGGVRNWDYRFCWIRDATFTLYALMLSGYREEAEAWRCWLLRTAAGRPEQLQILYGVRGERWLAECELPWLDGYEGSRPVRIGNAAHSQLQLDVFGEILDIGHQGRRLELEHDDDAWEFQKVLLRALEERWQEPDEGIWEVRGGRRHFTHSKAMAWVAFDRAVKAVERFGLDGDVERWRALRDRIHADVCEKGFSRKRNAFVQAYDDDEALDASALMLPLVGFLPPEDPRIAGTLDAIRQDLEHDGLLLRYRTSTGVDGLPAGEGYFLICSFWLADNLALMGRHEEAEAVFERLLALRNDVGLLAEEYDPRIGRQLGNFPQALSHVGLINTAHNLSLIAGPARRRATP
ncbi:glycoside hydrolase family 15 protein [Marinimicrococcus flavescens]|uniref:Trehalase n=1 Tax=Marinimicrococcus flavescens TaxID=3031815 RepID=A0AAP3V1H3_9PROT|nr:glycoside hydrolase family 15 protein [Marinimicrococcus flavescens]